MTRDTETGETTSKRTRTRLSFDASFSREEGTQQGGRKAGKERSDYSIEERFRIHRQSLPSRTRSDLSTHSKVELEPGSGYRRVVERAIEERAAPTKATRARSCEAKSAGLDRSPPPPPRGTSGPEFLHAVARGLAPTYHEWHETPPGESSRPK